MKNYKILILGAVLTFVGVSCHSDEDQQVTTLNDLVFADEFDVNGAPDPSKWTYDIGTGMGGWGNNELQYYTDRPENVVVEDGILKITAREESFQGSRFTSARILTKGLFQKQYGRYEARIKLPWGRGIWPAFWLLGEDSDGAIWPQIGEIDIMEYRGQEPTIVHGTAHMPGNFAGNPITNTYELQNERFDTGFHIFGIEWSPNRINFYVDDVLYQSITPADMDEGSEWVFNDGREMFIILNVAVGGSFVGPPGPDTVYPQTMEVDYVRVYE
ncbi:glycosyl hydrolase family 16 [Nonlabens spongiae]|uniref:Glycosyl hydrolase family 16 n=1 Tax=Nonlabens spongiae TaxID=331648 RepID=A0A1W6MG65_9FLAO|nr:glycoside hydrolase family 16 protein [Nonlabens spongiae]ARN76598.1 glycosyl hydrolase family 16 [Nonlabens spongiae]